MSVVIENRRSTDVFIESPNCNPSILIRVDTLLPGRANDNETEYATWPAGVIKATCQDVVVGECPVANCESSSPIRLIPGGTYATEWPGVVRTPRWLPEDCLSDDNGCFPGPCEVERAPATGERYVVSTNEVQPRCDDVDQCSCTPNADGWCFLATRDIESYPEPRYVDFVYPISEAVLALE